MRVKLVRGQTAALNRFSLDPSWNKHCCI